MKSKQIVTKINKNPDKGILKKKATNKVIDLELKAAENNIRKTYSTTIKKKEYQPSEATISMIV